MLVTGSSRHRAHRRVRLEPFKASGISTAGRISSLVALTIVRALFLHSRSSRTAAGLSTFARIANRRDREITSRRISSRLPARSGDRTDRPVMLPPGRAKLATSPAATGSMAIGNTTGTRGRLLYGEHRPRPAATIMSTSSRTNSAAISAKRSMRPSAQRYSIATVGPRSSRARAAAERKGLSTRSRPQALRRREIRLSAACPPAVRAPRAAMPPPPAEQRDELAAFHSITSSARASSVGGTSRPSALAVLRLITSLVLGRRLHRQVGRLLALEDAVDVVGRAPILVDVIGPIGDQAASGDEETFVVDRGQLVPSRQRDDQMRDAASRTRPPSRSDRHSKVARRPRQRARSRWRRAY